MRLQFLHESSKTGLVLSETALETILRFQQLSPRDREAGGQLFARFDGLETIIVEATGPKRLDRRSRNGFWPNRWLQRREIKNRYARALHFVGDWHTHPEAFPFPSRDDIAGMQECFQQSKHDLTAFVIIIVGTAPPPQSLYVALVSRDKLDPLIPRST